MSAVAETRRIDRGRGHSYVLDGGDADGVTWVLSQGYPKPALIEWAGNATAEYAFDHWAELDAMQPSERLSVMKRSRYIARDAAAIRGQDVHAQLQALAAGEDVYPNEDVEAHVDSYLRFVDDWQPQELLTEAVVGNRRYRYMGTLDFVGRLADGLRWLLDFKTGKGVYIDAALQLSAYRRAEFYLDAERAEHVMPEVDRCGVVHVRADGYDLYPLDVTDDTFRLFLYAQQLARFRERDSLGSVIGDSLRPPPREEA